MKSDGINKRFKKAFEAWYYRKILRTSPTKKIINGNIRKKPNHYEKVE